MKQATWLERLHCLAGRFPELGIGADLVCIGS
jgi:hypothetical protein